MSGLQKPSDLPALLLPVLNAVANHGSTNTTIFKHVKDTLKSGHVKNIASQNVSHHIRNAIQYAKQNGFLKVMPQRYTVKPQAEFLLSKTNSKKRKSRKGSHHCCKNHRQQSSSYTTSATSETESSSENDTHQQKRHRRHQDFVRSANCANSPPRMNAPLKIKSERKSTSKIRNYSPEKHQGMNLADRSPL